MSTWLQRTASCESTARRLSIQSEMRSVVLVIAEVLEAEAHHMSLVYGDHVIQHLTAYAAHPSFRNSVLPRTANTRPDGLNAARLQKRVHFDTEFPVTIKDDVSIWAWERQRLAELLHNPLACRVRGRVEVENAAPIVLDDEEAVQHP